MEAMSQFHSHSFYGEEMVTVLAEHESVASIANYQLLYSDAVSAIARITTLEGTEAYIGVSIAGYHVLTLPPGQPTRPEDLALQNDHRESNHFEALEPLLESISPKYAARRIEILQARLGNLTEGF